MLIIILPPATTTLVAERHRTQARLALTTIEGFDVASGKRDVVPIDTRLMQRFGR